MCLVHKCKVFFFLLTRRRQASPLPLKGAITTQFLSRAVRRPQGTARAQPTSCREGSHGTANGTTLSPCACASSLAVCGLISQAPEKERRRHGLSKATFQGRAPPSGQPPPALALQIPSPHFDAVRKQANEQRAGRGGITWGTAPSTYF